MSLLSFPSVFDHHFVTDEPRPLRSVWDCPITYLILRHSLASSIASTTFHFLPVLMVGCTVFTTGSSESSNMESNLALPHLYSSTIDLSGSFSFAFQQYIATSLRAEGTPNHLLVNLLILASIASAVVEQIS